MKQPFHGFFMPLSETQSLRDPCVEINQHRGFVSITNSKISFVLLAPVVEIRFFIQFYDS